MSLRHFVPRLRRHGVDRGRDPRHAGRQSRAPCSPACSLTEDRRCQTRSVLLAGESWVSAATHYKGFDQFGSVTFHLGAEPLVKALEGSDFDLHYMPAHEAATAFPSTMEGSTPTTR